MSCFENFDKIIILVFYIGKNNNNVGVPYGFPYVYGVYDIAQPKICQTTPNRTVVQYVFERN